MFIPSPTADAFPETLGQYRIVEKLGEGGMGMVFKVQHVRLKKIFALKTLSSRNVEKASSFARFQREMEVVARLDHPHLVRATDAGEASGVHFLVMEHIDGLDLQHISRALGPLPIRDACELIRQAALGLQHVHDNGLVHRDIKPSNLLVSLAGNLKIVDLGLALILDDDASDPDNPITASKQVMGTGDYLAPEQGINSHEVDIRSDIYSLGCTLYKLLVGRAPFADAYGSFHQKIQAHAMVVPLTISQQRPEVPEALSRLCERMMAKQPADRFQTPSDVAAALEPYCSESDLISLCAAALSVKSSLPHSPPMGMVDTHSFVPTAETTRPLVLPKKPNRRFPIFAYWIFLGALLTAGLAGAFFMIVKKEDPEPIQGLADNRLPSVPMEEKLTPWVWHNLLQTEPKKLHWPEGVGASQLIFNPKNQEAHLHAESMCLIRAGSAETSDYQLQVGIAQVRWSGGVGVFFGFQNIIEDGNPAQVFQMIELRPFQLNRDISRAFTLQRVTGKLWKNAQGKREYQGKSETAVPVPYPAYGEQILEITVDRGQLASVRWGGEEIAQLCRADLNKKFEAKNYQGPFGFYGNMSSTVFRNVRFKLFERDSP